jgi:hypothetical protein
VRERRARADALAPVGREDAEGVDHRHHVEVVQVEADDHDVGRERDSPPLEPGRLRFRVVALDARVEDLPPRAAPPRELLLEELREGLLRGEALAERRGVSEREHAPHAGRGHRRERRGAHAEGVRLHPERPRAAPHDDVDACAHRVRTVRVVGGHEEVARVAVQPIDEAEGAGRDLAGGTEDECGEQHAERGAAEPPAGKHPGTVVLVAGRSQSREAGRASPPRIDNPRSNR